MKKDDHGRELVEVDRDNKCQCTEPSPTLVNYSMMWHDGDIICLRCSGFIRDYDAG